MLYQGCIYAVYTNEHKELTYNGLLIIDTEGLRAPEHKQSHTYDNEFVTLIIVISNMVLIDMRVELATNMESCLQISTCALMTMSMIDIYPSVAFIH